MVTYYRLEGLGFVSHQNWAAVQNELSVWFGTTCQGKDMTKGELHLRGVFCVAGISIAKVCFV